jgi:putative transposon-encoded protein
VPRKIELKKGTFTLTENEVEGFLERVVTPIGTSAKADVPKRYIGRRAYVIITKNEGTIAKSRH